MATLKDFLLGLARDLNDAEEGYEFTKWTQLQLIDYINEAALLVAIFKPDFFSTTKVVELTPGSEQTACDCSIVTQIEGQCDKHGTLLYGYLPKRASAAQYRWPKKACPPPPGPFKLTGYSSALMGGPTFEVTPPVPVNPPIFVKLRCVVNPTPLKLSDVRRTFDYGTATPAVKQWVLYRAMLIDDESATGVGVAAEHLKLFFMLLKVQFSREMLQQIGLSSTPQAKEALSILRATGAIGTAV